jgi:hypothetical protein
MVYHALSMKNRNNIYLGMFLLGMTGVLIGVVLESVTASMVAGALGIIIGGFVGWLGGRRYLFIICLGALIGLDSSPTLQKCSGKKPSRQDELDFLTTEDTEEDTEIAENTGMGKGESQKTVPDLTRSSPCQGED